MKNIRPYVCFYVRSTNDEPILKIITLYRWYICFVIPGFSNVEFQYFNTNLTAILLVEIWPNVYILRICQVFRNGKASEWIVYYSNPLVDGYE